MPDPEVPPQSLPATPPTDVKPDVPDAFVLLVVSPPKFNLGQIVITSNAHAVLTPEDVSTALKRHSDCDWGELCAEDRAVNERGVRGQGMILSVYQSAKGIKFYVITDPGHEVTTLLLPEDY